MARKKIEVASLEEIMAQTVSGLRRAATRPTISGYRPMEKQLKFHRSSAKGRAFLGGNRSGKTVSGGAEMVMWLTGNHPYRPTPPPPVRMRAVAVDFDHGVEKIIKPEVVRWMPESYLVEGSWDKSFSKELRTLTLANGSTLEFMSYDQDLDKFAGTSRHGIWFDEEPPEDIFNENMMRLVDTGGEWWLTMTPVEGMTWVFDRIYTPWKSGLDNNIDVIISSMDENVHINSTEISFYMSGLSDEEKSARRHGQFVQFGGLIYGKSFTPANVVPDVFTTGHWDTIRKHWQHFLAMDHGFNNPTAWLWIAVNPDAKMLVYDEYYRTREVVAVHAQQVMARNKVLGIEPAYQVGDPSIRNTDPITGTSVQLEYQEYGVSIVLGNNDVKAGINMIARMFESKQLFISRRCENLLHELARYRWAPWQSKKIQQNRNPKEEPLKKDDHACDALRYGVASRPMFDALSPAERENVLNGSVPVDQDGPRIDYELLKLAEQQQHETYDSMLGSEF